MIIYVDVLLFLNAVVDFFLISVTASITHINIKHWRKISAALVSALFSLCIFLPPLGFAVELLMRLSSSVAAVITAFGFGSLKRFFRNLAVFYAASFIYAGSMAAIWMLLTPKSLSINNGIVYFDISPLVLITLSFVFYVIIVAVKKLTGRTSGDAKRVTVSLSFNNILTEQTAMVDTGHTLSDGFSESCVIIIDCATAQVLFGSLNTQLMVSLLPPEDSIIAKGFRLIPIKTVSGENVMPAVKLEKMKVTYKSRTFVINKPIAVISEGTLAEDYSVIVPPEVFNL